MPGIGVKIPKINLEVLIELIGSCRFSLRGRTDEGITTATVQKDRRHINAPLHFNDLDSIYEELFLHHLPAPR
jgi:hypothetical protein